MPLETIFNNLNYIKKDIVWYSFEMKNLFGKILGIIYIWTQNIYAEFIKRLNKLEWKENYFQDWLMQKKMKRKMIFELKG